MTIDDKIISFHEKINFKLKPLLPSMLKHHGIKLGEIHNGGRNQVKVRAFHFNLLSAKRGTCTSALLFSSNIVWKEIQCDEFYFEKELKEFAIQCLYLLSIPLGECVVQRCGKKEITVIKIRSLKFGELTKKEKELLLLTLENKNKSFENVTFGCDIELMVKNLDTSSFMNMDVLLKEGQIGLDDAIAVHKKKVIHPIVEVRSKPANNMTELFDDVFLLYKKLRKATSNHDLTIITDAHPFGRFFLGGHIHFGNIPLTFQHVRLLDQFVTIPFSYVEQKPSFQRRRYYGRLGSVKENRFQGFEYRVLPSWFKLIPNSLPLLLWVEFLMKNPTKLEASNFQKKDLHSYYCCDYQTRSLTNWINENEDYFIEKREKALFNNYVSFLKKLV
ncbi:hypothetical protein BKP45_20355 [Anaerobacillus alkalidiazotrophicus]|uniref:Uncharacterized protein n=1 Tax=Anaerobacillus alkalidiazotrophicus TaxID=472963 RepID=A0A1S2LZP2_9BACI|nr:hypothetical protein [Anaerobacillus alkalidiazotrophicus]OIJ17911.1 hypothetical protein BKP45_20355 [Anaerobacillus alkalidiazotrophicus]